MYTIVKLSRPLGPLLLRKGKQLCVHWCHIITHVLKFPLSRRSFFVYVGIAWRFFFPRKKRSVVGEVALITGAGNGIGRDLALQMGRLGAIVGMSCQVTIIAKKCIL